LTEAVQVLLARCQAEILAASETEQPEQGQQSKPVISMAQWRPKEPAHVEKVRLARRAGRYVRYQQVVELHTQGMKPKEIAGRLSLSDRTVHRWLASGTFDSRQEAT
jgi:DNA-binding NarL/FixJ family response regulator